MNYTAICSLRAMQSLIFFLLQLFAAPQSISQLNHQLIQKNIQIMNTNIESSIGKQSRICVLKAEVGPNEKDSTFLAEEYLRRAGYTNVTLVAISKLTCGAQLDQVMNSNYDLIFNICDGGSADFNSGYDVAQYLSSKCNIPFVGPTVQGQDPTRQSMKRACLLNKLCTAKHAFVYNIEQDFEKLNQLSFPMIVKHFQSAGSLDITKDSKVNNKVELYVQVKRMLDLHHGALVEQFIEGKEIACLVAESGNDSQLIAYKPMQYVFLQGGTFLTEELKFVHWRKFKKVSLTDEALSNKVKELSKTFFRAMDARNYARVDFRHDSKGNLSILEINPLPGAFYPPNQYGVCDQILHQAPGGHSAFLENIIKDAGRRHQKEKKDLDVTHINARGFSCKAACDFSIDQIVYDWSDREVKLRPVTKLSQLANSPGEAQIKERFYLPVSSTHVIVSENHLENYKFFRPSDDPNCWLEGLRLVARREIAAGEELSFDYSTLYGSDWTNLYTGDSSQTNWKEIELKYSSHISEFVKAMAAKQL